MLGTFHIENMNNNFLFNLNYIANLCQLLDFQMNVSQLSNDDLMKHLLEQDKVLNEEKDLLNNQIKEYLKELISQNKTIIEQNNEIIRLIEEKGFK